MAECIITSSTAECSLPDGAQSTSLVVAKVHVVKLYQEWALTDKFLPLMRHKTGKLSATL